MNMSSTVSNALQIFHSVSCQDIDEFFKDLNASEYESHNMTRDDYIASLRSPYCEPKPYPGVQGLKKWAIRIILISFLIFGLIGNTLSATIMFRRSRRGLSSYFYLALLAITDICILYSGCLLYMLDMVFDYHPQLNSSFSCRLTFYLQHVFTYISAWLIVSVTFERFMVVRFPLQSIRICRMRIAYRIAIIIFFIFLLYSMHYFFTINLIQVSLQTDEGYHPNYAVCDLTIHRKLIAFIDLCLYSIVPAILIIIFNCLIISTIFHAIRNQRDYLLANTCMSTTNTSQRNRNKTSLTARSQCLRSRSGESTPAVHQSSQVNKQRIFRTQKSNKDIEQPNKNKGSQKNLFDPTSGTGKRLTCLLLIISFIFVLCTLPISIRSLIADYVPLKQSTQRWQLVHVCLTLLMYFNHTVNFILYCVTGRSFRSECRKILCNLWFLRDLKFSCTMKTDPNKHANYRHQQLIQFNRHDFIRSHPQRQYMRPVVNYV